MEWRKSEYTVSQPTIDIDIEAASMIDQTSTKSVDFFHRNRQRLAKSQCVERLNSKKREDSEPLIVLTNEEEKGLT